MTEPVVSNGISFYKPLHQACVRNAKIGITVFALILVVGAIVAPFSGVGVTGSILLGVGAAVFLCSGVSQYKASRKEQEEANKKLLDAAAEGKEQDVKDALGTEEVYKGKKSVPRWSEGANVNCRDKAGKTPLSLAVNAYAATSSCLFDTKVIQILLKNGARKDQLVWDKNMTAGRKNEVTGQLDEWATELRPLYEPTRVDRFFKNWL